MSFATDIVKFAAKAGKSAEDVVVGTIHSINELTIDATPVISGRARGSWVATLDRPSFASPFGVDPSGNSTKKKANAVAVNAGGSIYYLTSNLVYIGVLEFGGYPNPPQKGSYIKKSKSYEKLSVGGYSKQAPGGMARIAVKAAKRQINKLANEENR